MVEGDVGWRRNWPLGLRSFVLDRGFVGALLRRDLSGYRITLDDARRIVHERVLSDAVEALSNAPDQADPEARGFLTGAVKSNAMRSLAQAGTATRVAGILADAGVRVLVYKGVALAALTTGQWLGRQSADVDVLIDRADVGRAHDALIAAGLHRVGATWAPDRFFVARAIETSYAGLPVGIDLHWDVEFPGYLGLPFDDLWSRRHRIDDSGLGLWTLSRPDALLVGSLHGTREEWRSFRQILDFAELAVRLSPGEWETAQVLSQAGARKSLAVALVVAEESDCRGLPARPTDRARHLGARYLRHDPAQGPQRLGRRPLDALDRRLGRWRTAPGLGVATHAALMAAVRQVVDPKRSWSWRRT